MFFIACDALFYRGGAMVFAGTVSPFVLNG